MNQFLSGYEVHHRESDVPYNIFMLGLIYNDKEDWSWTLIAPTEEGLKFIITLIQKLRADNRETFVEYPLLTTWKLYVYYALFLKDVGNYALAKRSLEYALHFEMAMDCQLFVIDDIEDLGQRASYSCMVCSKAVDEIVAPGDLPCGCIFKFCSAVCLDTFNHDSRDCSCEKLRTVIFELE
jgi:hypothetical protein